MCRCDWGTENTTIEELQVLFHALNDRELRNKASLMIRVFPIRELKPGGLCYLSTCAKLYLEIGLNYSIICNLDRVMVFKATFNNISVRS